MPTPSTLPDVADKAAKVDALQRGFTSARDERSIAEVFLSTNGVELTALKNAIDAGEDYHTLHELMYHDIGDHGIRSEIFSHIASQGTPRGELKILSDIDDTFYENWIDARYPKKTVYPGVRELYRELDLGPSETGVLGDLVFLTARPYDRLGVTDKLTHSMLHANGVMQATVLAGDFLHLATNELIAEEKNKRFLEFAPLYPEYEFVFLGDSGQGDALAGAMMLKHPLVRAVFIHDVKHHDEAARAAQREQRIFFHDTYVGAAVYACGLGLISRAGMVRVAQGALAALGKIEFETQEAADTMNALFARDVAAMNAILPENERLTF
jgi:hypothetical protein